MDYFFGYGSLVNRQTHDYADAQIAVLHGWQRVWRHTPHRPVAFLTAVPAPDAEIDGLVARVDGDWSALDLREEAYDRVPAKTIRHSLPPETHVQVYTIPADKHGPATRANPVLLSYLDTVVLGYLHEFGEDGVTRFFETTEGWDVPIADDRADPLYPRYTALTGTDRARVDGHLDRLGCTLCAPPKLTL